MLDPSEANRTSTWSWRWDHAGGTGFLGKPINTVHGGAQSLHEQSVTSYGFIPVALIFFLCAFILQLFHPIKSESSIRSEPRKILQLNMTKGLGLRWGDSCKCKIRFCLYLKLSILFSMDLGDYLRYFIKYYLPWLLSLIEHLKFWAWGACLPCITLVPCFDPCFILRYDLNRNRPNWCFSSGCPQNLGNGILKWWRTDMFCPST